MIVTIRIVMLRSGAKIRISELPIVVFRIRFVRICWCFRFARKQDPSCSFINWSNYNQSSTYFIGILFSFGIWNREKVCLKLVQCKTPPEQFAVQNYYTLNSIWFWHTINIQIVPYFLHFSSPFSIKDAKMVIIILVNNRYDYIFMVKFVWKETKSIIIYMLNNLNNILEKFIGNKSSNNIENFNQIEEKFRKILLKRGKTQEFFEKILFFFQ